MKTFQEQERAEKVASLPRDKALKLVFQWVKTGVVNAREFPDLLESVPEPPAKDRKYCLNV